MQGEHTLERSFQVADGEEIPNKRFVDIDETGVSLSAGDPDGVSIDGGGEGTYIGVALLGPAQIEAGAAIEQGQRVESDANGRAVPLDAGDEAGLCLSQAVAPAGGDHDQTEVAVGI